MSPHSTLTFAKLQQVKEIFERNAKFREPHRAWITAKQWVALGGRPDIWHMLPEIAPGLREVKAE